MSPGAPYSLKDMFADLANFQKVMNDVQASLRNPEHKARLGDLLDQLKKARANAEEQVPAILQEKVDNANQLKAEMEAAREQIKQKLEELQAKKKEAEEKQKPPAKEEAPPAETEKPAADGKTPAGKPGYHLPPLPTLPEVPINITLGDDLRVELLKAYGGLVTRGR